MKTRTYIPLFIILLILVACKKDTPVTRVIKFTSTTYQTLGTFDSLGEPDYLLAKDTISPALLSFIKNTLPERIDLRTTHPELLASSAIGDIPITQTSDVFVTFVAQTGGYTNSMAFYTYPTTQPPASAKDIQLITYIFPNSGILTTLKAGDKVKIGRFDPGTSVGFVLLQKGWDTTVHKLTQDVVHFCSNDVLNPEVDPKLKKHAVLIDYTPENKVLIGFEDLDRTKPQCDNDFNDVIIYCTVTP
jgi:hypothetical protein